jgi:hypothetical protein
MVYPLVIKNSKLQKLVDIDGVVQRQYKSELKLDLLDQTGKEWKVEFSFDTPVYIGDEKYVYFDHIEDLSEISVSGYRESEHEIKAKEAWLTKSKNEASKYLSYNLFFSNSDLSSENNDCIEVFPVSRSIKGKRNVKGALKYTLVLTDLINGPSKSETENKYFSSIPINTSFNEIELQDEGAKVIIDFENLDVSGSCNVQNARSQIEKTFYQFPEIKTVVILLNGDESVVLQP